MPQGGKVIISRKSFLSTLHTHPGAFRKGTVSRDPCFGYFMKPTVFVSVLVIGNKQCLFLFHVNFFTQFYFMFLQWWISELGRIFFSDSVNILSIKLHKM